MSLTKPAPPPETPLGAMYYRSGLCRRSLWRVLLDYWDAQSRMRGWPL